MIQIKRVYDSPRKGDGVRILVDRLWPRGIKKENLNYDEWPKELAPSSELRKKFHSEDLSYSEFKKEYRKELKQDEAHEKVVEIAKVARKKNVTLLYGAKDTEHNNAVVLKETIESYLNSK